MVDEIWRAQGKGARTTEGVAAAATRTSGGSIPGLSRAAFVIARQDCPAIPVLIGVPHAGRAYPADLVARLRHGVDAMHRLEDRHVDAVARAAAAQCGAVLMIAEAPRAMIDLNRDASDIDESMLAGGRSGKYPRTDVRAGHRSARGLGVFPRRLSGLGELWRDAMTEQEAERRIAAIHAPYHAALSLALGEIRDQWGAALLIDLHSMPGLAGDAEGRSGASHVVGDRFGASCARVLSAEALDVLADEGMQAAYNRPYAGGYVLDRHGAPRDDVHALQIEIDRACYLHEDGQIRPDGVARQAGIIARLANTLARRLMDGALARHAAE